MFFEILMLGILLFGVVVYVIKSDLSKPLELPVEPDILIDTTHVETTGSTGTTGTTGSTGSTGTCKKKCMKPTETDGKCRHPIKYNELLGKNQEVKSELICPWSCSSGYSDDPETCQYDQECESCSPSVSFQSIDERCPKSKWGCCGDCTTAKTDEFGNNCLITGASGPCKEGFETLSQTDPALNNDQNLYIIKSDTKMPPQMYPTCPNIQCPNENAFNKDNKLEIQNMTSLGTLTSWSVITNYATA